MKHELKCWPKEFIAIVSEIKRFEYRQNDREFEEGDILWLREWSPERHYTSRTCEVVVNYILKDKFGVPENYCVMSIDVLYFNPGS